MIRYSLFTVTVTCKYAIYRTYLGIGSIGQMNRDCDPVFRKLSGSRVNIRTRGVRRTEPCLINSNMCCSSRVSSLIKKSNLKKILRDQKFPSQIIKQTNPDLSLTHTHTFKL